MPRRWQSTAAPGSAIPCSKVWTLPGGARPGHSQGGGAQGRRAIEAPPGLGTRFAPFLLPWVLLLKFCYLWLSSPSAQRHVAEACSASKVGAPARTLLCHAMPPCAVLCHAVPFCAMPLCAVLCQDGTRDVRGLSWLQLPGLAEHPRAWLRSRARCALRVLLSVMWATDLPEIWGTAGAMEQSHHWAITSPLLP